MVPVPRRVRYDVCLQYAVMAFIAFFSCMRTTWSPRMGYNVGWFKWSLFRIFEIISFCFVVAIFDLVHDVEAIYMYDIFLLLTTF